jgi:hypothetical protein
MNNDIEEWKPVLGFEGFYALSSRGRVKSLCRVVIDRRGQPRKLSERIMLCSVKDNGYLHVSLRKPGEKQVKRLIHRLVAIAFLSTKNETDEVNHIDGNKLNNVTANLEWCNHAQNMAHAWDNGLFQSPRTKEWAP